MNTIDKVVRMLDKYDLKFTIKSIVMAEKELVGHSVLQVFANMAPAEGRIFGLGDVYTLLKWGLLGADVKLSAEDVDNVFCEAVEEIGLDGVAENVFAALAKSGLVKFQERKNQSAPDKAEPNLATEQN